MGARKQPTPMPLTPPEALASMLATGELSLSLLDRIRAFCGAPIHITTAAWLTAPRYGEQMNFKHELGDKARDVVTGFEGVIIGRAQHLTGCNTYGVQPPSKDGKKDDAAWFDEQRIETVESNPTLRERLAGATPKDNGAGPDPVPTNRVG
jgi:hypothetical protein